MQGVEVAIAGWCVGVGALCGLVRVGGSGLHGVFAVLSMLILFRWFGFGGSDAALVAAATCLAGLIGGASSILRSGETFRVLRSRWALLLGLVGGSGAFCGALVAPFVDETVWLLVLFSAVALLVVRWPRVWLQRCAFVGGTWLVGIVGSLSGSGGLGLERKLIRWGGGSEAEASTGDAVELFLVVGGTVGFALGVGPGGDSDGYLGFIWVPGAAILVLVSEFVASLVSRLAAFLALSGFQQFCRVLVLVLVGVVGRMAIAEPVGSLAREVVGRFIEKTVCEPFGRKARMGGVLPERFAAFGGEWFQQVVVVHFCDVRWQGAKELGVWR